MLAKTSPANRGNKYDLITLVQDRFRRYILVIHGAYCPRERVFQAWITGQEQRAHRGCACLCWYTEGFLVAASDFAQRGKVTHANIHECLLTLVFVLVRPFAVGLGTCSLNIEDLLRYSWYFVTLRVQRENEGNTSLALTVSLHELID